MGEGGTFWERKKTRVSFEDCRGAMAVSSILRHMERIHRIVLPHTQGVYVEGGGTETYVVSFPRVLKSMA